MQSCGGHPSALRYSNEITLLESLRGKTNIIQLVDYEINRASKAKPRPADRLSQWAPWVALRHAPPTRLAW